MNSNSKKTIRTILGKKQISKQEYDLLIDLVKPYQETEVEYYNFIMARILLGKKEFTKAQLHLNKVIESNPKHKSAYYHMYKIQVFKENHEEALYNLNKYEELNEDITMNNSLIKSMLNYMIMLKDGYQSFKNDDFQVSQTETNNYFGRVNIKNLKIQDLYTDLIEEFNKKNLSNMKRVLNKLIQEINETNYPIEVYTLTKLFHSILNISNKYHTEIMTNDEFLKENIENISRNILDNNIPPRKISKYINRIIELDPILAEKLLHLHLRNNFFYLNEITVKTLTNKINEKKLYLILSEKGKAQYHQFKKDGQKAYRSGNLEKAYEIYSKAEYEIKHPIFDYYVGKILYKLGMYNEAKKRIEKYLENGGEKTSKALIYLLGIEVKNSNHKQVNKYKDLINIVNNDLGNDFTIKDSINKNEEDIDYQKQRASARVKMTEQDFIETDDEVKIEEYYYYDLDKKLKVIKKLLRQGNLKEANYLLNELKPNTKAEYYQIKNFTKNKTLYLNQK